MKTLAASIFALAILFGMQAKGLAQEENVSLHQQLQVVLDRVIAANPDAVGVMVHVEAPGLNLSWSGAAGHLDKQKSDPIDPTQPALIASNTKTYMAAAILRLVEKQLLTVDDSIESLISEASARKLRSDGYQLNEIKVRHLLSHTSGIHDYIDEAYMEFAKSNPKHRWTREEQISLAMKIGDPLGRPEDVFRYADINFLLLGEVLERKTGKPFHLAIRELIDFRKRGLDATWFATLDEPPQAAKPMVCQLASSYGLNSKIVDPSFDLYGAGGIAAPTRDLARFSQSLFNREIIRDAKTLQLIFTPAKTADGTDHHYHFGLSSSTINGFQAYGHGGFWGTVVQYLPKLNASIAVYVLERDQGSLRKELLEKIVKVVASKKIAKQTTLSFQTNSRLTLGMEAAKSASVRCGDLDGDGDLDLVVANGRHWPQQNRIFLNQGRSRFTVSRPLGVDLSTTYACEIGDLDGDGDLDIVTGNDMAPCEIFLNDGKAQFQRKSSFGTVSSVRSLKLADIDRDGDMDILVTCRGRTNAIYLNDGNANFDSMVEFGTRNDSTIDVDVGDVNEDGHLDLVLANRDGQPNAWLLNDGKLRFEKPIPFGPRDSQSRAVVVGDFNGDKHLDWAIGNIGQPNKIYYGDGKGGVLQKDNFGKADGPTYSLAATDLDLDGDLDLIVGNAGKPNAAMVNQGDSGWSEVLLSRASLATYGICAGDLNGDRFPDIATANSDAINQVFLTRAQVATKSTPASRTSVESAPEKPSTKTSKPAVKTQQETNRQEAFNSEEFKSDEFILEKFSQRAEYRTGDWPSFRGLGGRGVAEGFSLPTTWNADSAAGDIANVAWQVPVPGLGHSSPVVAGDHLYLLTAVAREGKAPLQVQSGGKPTAADDNGVQDWKLLCYQKQTGKLNWEKTLCTGKPKATRHAKATHANTSVTVVGNQIIAFLGSEGLYCCTSEGKLEWKQDLGVINISKYGIGWGFASSPAVHDDRIVLVCDDPQNPFVGAYQLDNGQEIWKTSRKSICERSWGTPLIHVTSSGGQVVVNGWPWIVSYDLQSGKEIWRMKGGGDNPVPTPFEAHGYFYITNAHGGPSPIYAVRPQARGDLSPALLDSTDSSNDGAVPNRSLVWHTSKGGSYMSTPVVYRDQIYVGDSRGIIRSFNAFTGKQIFQSRLGSKAGMIASLVAGDGKIYCAAENGTTYVLEHGKQFKLLGKNSMGAPCLASPAISEGTLFIRTTDHLLAIKQKEQK